jgi:hypothetical protein
MTRSFLGLCNETVSTLAPYRAGPIWQPAEGYM